MKKVILAVIALTAFAANAQDGFKDRWFLMGNVSFGSKTTPEEGLMPKQTVSTYTVLPAVGYFVAPTTAVGLAIGYTGVSTKVDGGDKENGGTFIVQPLARKYWGVTDNFLLFGEAAVPLSFTKSGDYKESSVGVNLGLGMDYFLSKNWSVEAKLGVLGWESSKPKDGDATNSFNLNVDSGLGQALSLGVKYVF